ncbi:EAL and HDOD domain-containing protein [Dactylosporangium aurantiacum]|uniref:EAL and HDOD domain-containing protein n=1 Tax=Dactylosporangium aurantiacum TaxID=35754 RepID=UPI001FE061E0|nr:HDOD domain-containing protein [Dactylosporangium aurantiacum]MDG6102008.1 HDOD domain-containing protein [Dactylosporangium aurantiacum]
MQPATTSHPDATQLVHIGRQPLYDWAGHVVGYELLFRGAADEVEASRRSAYATSQVIVNAFTEFGLEQLVGGRKCFINLTRDFLVGDLPLPFDPDHAILEILETVEIDDAVLAGTARLVQQGYEIALDDFVFGLGHERLLGLAAYVKLDLLIREPDELMEVVERCRRYPGIKLVAERVETEEHILLAKQVGFDLLQGYAVGRPQVLTAVALSPSRLRRLELLGAVTAEDADIAKVSSIVQSDPALSYRVLRATNSAASGLPRKVASVRDAVVLLGSAKIRQWAALMLVSDVAESATEDQLSTTMARARLCQTVAERLGLQGDAAFTVGLLAGVAELISEPVAELVNRLPLTVEVADALVDGHGRLGQVLSIVRAYEVADEQALATSPVSSVELAKAYLAAVGWSMRTIEGALGR